MGKSTLVNALIPGAARVVGVVNDVTGRGRHTSTSAVALRLAATEVPATTSSEVAAEVAPGAAAQPDHADEADQTAQPAPNGAAQSDASISARPNGSAEDTDLHSDAAASQRHSDGVTTAATDDAIAPDALTNSPGTEELPSGWVIDTPGVRSFGLAHVAPEAVVTAFPDLAAITAQCPRGCTHMADAPDCLLDEFPVDPARLDSLRRLLSALTSGD